MKQAELAMDHVAIRVRSFDASIGFYAALLPRLGFSRDGDASWRGARGLQFALVEAEPGTQGYDRYAPGVNHIGFAAPSLQTVEEVRDAMAAAGFTVPALQRFGGVSALFLPDPDGLRFEITYYGETAQ